MRIAFRVDASEQIGMGHLMRCLSLAKVALVAGDQVWFLSQVLLRVEQVAMAGVQVIWLKTNQPEELKLVLTELEIGCLIIDHYQVDDDFFCKLKHSTQVSCYLDDLNSFSYLVDLVVNGNLGAEKLAYQRSPLTKEVLLGIKYNLIRDEFRDLPAKQVTPEIKKILITTGGSDPAQLSPRLIEALRELSIAGVQFDLVVGNGFQNHPALVALAENTPGLVLHQKVERISVLMQAADLAIAAGGSSLYELAACGVYTLAFIYAANQFFLVEQMSEAGLVVNLGWYETLEFEKLVGLVQQADYTTRYQVARLGQSLVDAQGAVRVYQTIALLMKEKER